MTAVVVTRAGTAGRVGLSAAGLLALLLAAAPYLVTSDITHTLVDLFVFVVIATMWNLLAGYGGLVSVGQQAYLGAGAYAVIALSVHGGINAFLAVPLAALAAGLLAVPLSFLAFRLHGGYFAIGTWVLAEVVKLVTAQIGPLGKGSGASLTTVSGYDPDIRVAYTYWLALAVAAGSVTAVYLLIRTRTGLQLTAIRDDGIAAEAAGVRVRRAKRLVYLIAGTGTGAAGAIVCLNTLTVQPESVFSVQWSAYMIFMVVVGGIGTIEGPIVGALLFFGLQQALSAQGPVYLIILGAVGVAVVLLAPRGLWGSTVGRTSISVFPVGHTLR
ncbi:branched-chain amino acid ABC transporter permease [Paractinoplanes toevensis]|uniref:Branched-chain amino acid ABC transporter permease n=1 Tax=Paractinoplanes toevensis TaxID=571911 RepID=A0A919T6T2_9ACTN|nr:branched-chain amino acid ABC transporter permease [Actinoplanes toevensis]GIM90203.1 branched-chain amino acid ABC transporter permease [Actinoplanes toevensis]